MDMARIKRFVELSSRKRDIKDELSRIESEMKELDPEIQEDLIQAGVTSMKVDGFTVYVQSQLWAKVAYQNGENTDQGYERAAAALQAAGLGEFVKPRFHTGQLSAFVRELVDAGDPIPDEFDGAIEVSEVFQVRTRKSG